MCLLIAQPKGARVSKQSLNTAYWNNPDGCGYAFIDRKTKTIVTKRYMKWSEFWPNYKADWTKHGKQSPFIVHFRLATHGTTSVDNAHPFEVKTDKGDTVFAHNGIISINIPKEYKHMSDTAMFGMMYLDYLPDDWVDNPAIVELVEEYLGQGNKIALLTTADTEKELYILNDWLGHEDKRGVWFSNHSYETSKYKGWNSKGKDSKGYVWAWTEDTYQGYVDKPKKTKKEIESEDELAYALAADEGYCIACMYKPCDCANMCWECYGSYDDAGNPCDCCWMCGDNECDCKYPGPASDYITPANGYKIKDKFDLSKV